MMEVLLPIDNETRILHRYLRSSFQIVYVDAVVCPQENPHLVYVIIWIYDIVCDI